MKKSLIMLTLAGAIMASSTVAFGYDNVSLDSSSETIATMEAPAEKSNDQKPAEEKKPTMTEEDKTKKTEEKKPTMTEEDKTAPKQEEKKPTLNETDEKKQDTKTPENKDEKTPGKHMRKPGCENKTNPECENKVNPDNKTNEKKAQ